MEPLFELPQYGEADRPIYLVLEHVAAVRVYNARGRHGDFLPGVAVWLRSGEKLSCRTDTLVAAKDICDRLLQALRQWHAEVV